MEDEWESTKRELVSYFSQNEVVWSGAGRGDGTTAWGQQATLANESRRMTNAFGGVGDVSEGVKRKMLEYARRVLELNEKRKQGKPYPLAFRFGQAAAALGSGDASLKGIKNCWDLLQSIMCEDVSPSGEGKTEPTLEGEYENERRVQGTPTVKVLRHWLSGSRQFLEEQFYGFIEDYVRKNAKDVSVGSMPGRENVIQGFVQAFLSRESLWGRLEKPDGVNPIWAQIYYAMRSGQLDAAEKFAKQVGDKSQFFKWYGHYRSDPTTHILPSDLSVQVMGEYRRLSSQDPYKHLVYNLVGQCDPMRSHDDIHRFATEDYMWFKLNMVTVEEMAPGAMALLQQARAATPGGTATTPSFGMPSSAAVNSFTLAHFQSLITEYGPEHFGNPVLYFQLLILSLQFEKAIHFLESTGQFPVETLHFALTLYYYGALHTPEMPLTAPLMGHQQRSQFWNVVRHITQYIRNFDNSNVLAALNYLYVIRKPETRNACLRDLLTDSQEFALLLGSVKPDGTRQPGYLEKFISENDWREVVSLAALAYEQAGKYDDAISLFDSAMQYDRVVDLLTKQLSRLLTGGNTGPERQRMIEYAVSRYEKYARETRSDKVWITAMASFRMLLQLCDFFNYYHASKYHEALDIIADLGLLPLDHRQLESSTTVFKTVSDPIRRNFSEIVLATMTCLYRMFIIIKEEGLNAEREAFLTSLKIKARAIVTFTGMINVRMPADTQSRLVRMEASMT